MNDRIWLFCYGTLMSEQVYASVVCVPGMIDFQMAKSVGTIDRIHREPGRLVVFRFL